MRFRLPGLMWIAAILWILAEWAAFGFVTARVGLSGAFLIGALTLAAGIATLRRVGRGALEALRRTAEGGAPGQGGLLEGTLATLGGLLLILPGFLSDLVGLALAIPAIRSALASRFGGGIVAARRAPDGVVDLDPAEWRSAASADAPRVGRDRTP